MPTTEADSAAASGIAGLDIGKEDDNSHEDFAELRLSETERKILEAYDRLEELQLEISLLSVPEPTLDESEAEVTDEVLQAEKEALLEAKARYALKKSIAESIMIANPILKAVHAGENASPIEKDLLPLIQQRDELSTQLADTSAKVLAARETLTATEAERIILSRRNTELASTMMELAEKANSQKRGNIKDPETRQQIEELERELKTSRQRWRLMKGTASGVVAGSGIDWSRDEKLRALVLEVDSDDE